MWVVVREALLAMVALFALTSAGVSMISVVERAPGPSLVRAMDVAPVAGRRW